MIEGRRAYQVTLEDVAESAAYLIAVINDRHYGVPRRSRLSDELCDALRILEDECDSLGLLHQFTRLPDGRYDLWPDLRRRERVQHLQSAA